MGRLDLVRRGAAYLVAAGCVWFAGSAIVGAFRGTRGPVAAAVIALGLFALAIGLLRMNRYARRVVAVFALIMAIIIPIGVINPFAALDYPGEAPDVTRLLALVVPFVVGMLLLAWLLDPPRSKLQ